MNVNTLNKQCKLGTLLSQNINTFRVTVANMGTLLSRYINALRVTVGTLLSRYINTLPTTVANTPTPSTTAPSSVPQCFFEGCCKRTTKRVRCFHDEMTHKTFLCPTHRGRGCKQCKARRVYGTDTVFKNLPRAFLK